jgi:beta-N-acetylhexosaminidase
VSGAGAKRATLVVAVIVVAGCLIASGHHRGLASLSLPRGDSAAPEPHRTPQHQAPSATELAIAKARKLPLARLVGAKLLVRMRGTAPSRDLLRRIRRGQIGGIVLFGDNIGTRVAVRSLTRRLRVAARAGGEDHGLIIAVDQEGGVVKRIESAPPRHSAAELGAIGSTRTASREGAATGRYLRRLGINVDFAPVYDTISVHGAFMRVRSFGTRPRLVGKLATAFARGLQSKGVAATAKHFPGLGSAVRDTDKVASVATGSKPVLAAEAQAFARGTRGGIDLVMLSTAVYPTYDPGVPAAFSPRIVTGRLRKKLGFDRVVVTDALDTPAVSSYTSASNAAVLATRAGADLLTFAHDEYAWRPAYRALLHAARHHLSRADLESSYVRIQLLKAELDRG